MNTLILILSLRSQFNHNVDIKVIPNLVSESRCVDVRRRIIDDLKILDPQIEVVAYCEKNL